MAVRAPDAPQTLSPDEIRSRVARLPRIPFAFVPTPLEACPRLTAALGGPRVLVKRDDLTGFAFGGQQGAGPRVPHGGRAGQRVRRLRAGQHRAEQPRPPALRGLHQAGDSHDHRQAQPGGRRGHRQPPPRPHARRGDRRGRGPGKRGGAGRDPGPPARRGAHAVRLHPRALLPPGRDGRLHRGGDRAARPAPGGRRRAGPAGAPVPGGRHLLRRPGPGGQAARAPLAGTRRERRGATPNSVRKMVLDLAGRVGTLLDLPAQVEPGDIDVHDQYVGDRYGATPATTLEAIKLAARTDAIFMDPVYTGKAFSGLVGEVRAGRVPADDVAVFVHTGGPAHHLRLPRGAEEPRLIRGPAGMAAGFGFRRETTDRAPGRGGVSEGDGAHGAGGGIAVPQLPLIKSHPVRVGPLLGARAAARAPAGRRRPGCSR